MLALSIVIELVSNAVRKQHLPIIGDWSNEGRLISESGDTLVISFLEAVMDFKHKAAIFIDARDADLFEQRAISRKP